MTASIQTEKTITLLTNLNGRLRNTQLPLSNGLMPLYEAVVNSIHAIEEAEVESDSGCIEIEILRKPKQSRLRIDDRPKQRGPDALEDITGFTISDNGIGFNDENLHSFQELDSDHKASKGCRGIGRLLWLKAFKRVYINSTFKDAESIHVSRAFQFDPSGVSSFIEQPASTNSSGTTVHLDDFSKQYRESAPKAASTIATSILEHCLWYFIRAGSAPQITILDDGESISLNDEFDHRMHSSSSRETINIKGTDFELTHVRRRSTALSSNSLALCAASRLVTEEKIDGRIPGLYGRLSDDKGEFVYSCYVCSTFLDKSVRQERTGFAILEKADGTVDSEISLIDIKSKVLESIKVALSPLLESKITKAKERVTSFIDKKAPRYKSIIGRIPSEVFAVNPDISDKDLDLALHKELSVIEQELLSEGHDILTPRDFESKEAYEKRITEYMSKAEDIKKSDLANYVAHRRVILDLLDQAIKRNPDGSYSREDVIHRLIMPMIKDSSEVHLDSCNLWLIDERLAFHDYLASDKTIASMPITDSIDGKEPDLFSLSVYDNPILVNEGSKLPLASIVVVELKRPMRNDAKSGEEHDPIEQAIGYLTRIRNGGVQTKNGRPIPNSQDIPGFCYIIADLTPKLIERCRYHHDLTATADGMGFFSYKKNAKAYVEVISLEKLVNSAKERNRAFFDKLGLPVH